MIMVSCSDSSDVAEDTSSPAVECKILFNVEKPAGMRMADAVVQTEGQAFRGLQSLLVVPFKTSGDDVPVTASDVPLLSSITNAQKVTNENSNNLYYVVSCSLMKGGNRVLAYARAAYADNLAAEKDNGALEIRYNGALATSLRDRMNPSELTFNLKSIHNTTDVHADAQDLADYLTAIANTETTTEKWSTTSDGQLKDLYRDFIHIDGEGTGIIAGSATNVKAYADALKTQITVIKNHSTTPETSKTLCEKILASINANTTISGNTYPAPLGLPDGAAALRWMEDDTDNQYKFMVRTQTTTMDNINSINRYTYPAELWYYANSGIQTSTNEVKEEDYKNATSWGSLLNAYQSGTVVNDRTRSVAVKDALQYGVARLQCTLKSINNVQLKDAKNEVVNNAIDDYLPLTSVIVGAQHTVGFDFKPQGVQSDVDGRFIYDAVVGSRANGSWTVNTLVLQTYNGEKVPVVLEFQNNIVIENNEKVAFTGKDGIIYPGCKFYLVAMLDPADYTNTNAPDAAKGRVFTQDYTTAVEMKITSLANAYSCMPDLLSPRLEIGVQVQTKWIQSTTTTVKLN